MSDAAATVPAVDPDAESSFDTPIDRSDQARHILDTAARLMAESGLRGVSMRALAAECGCNVATLYHYFPSKQALFDAVIESRRFDELMAEVPELDRSAPLEERAAAVISWILHRSNEHEGVWRLLLGESLRGTPQATSAAHTLTVMFEQMLAQWFDELTPDLPGDPMVVARVVRATIYGVLVETLLRPEREREAILDARAGELAAVIAGGSAHR